MNLLRLFILNLIIISAAFAQDPAPLPPGNQRVSVKAMTPAEFRFAAAMRVVADRCVACHRSGGAATDFASLLLSELKWLNAGLVVKGSSQTSLLYKYLQGSGFSPPPLGTMPQGSQFSALERNTIKDWINQMGEPIDNTPEDTPDDGDNSHGLLPSSAQPHLGDRWFVKGVLDRVFGPSAAAITTAEVSYRVSIFGGACDPMMQPPPAGDGGDICPGVDTSLFRTPVVPPTNASRAGRSMLVCNMLVFRDAPVQYAISAATGKSNLSYLNSSPIPTAAEVNAAWRLFKPGSTDLSTLAVNELLQLAQTASEPTKPLDPWRYVFLSLCYDPTWQVI